MCIHPTLPCVCEYRKYPFRGENAETWHLVLSHILRVRSAATPVLPFAYRRVSLHSAIARRTPRGHLLISPKLVAAGEVSGSFRISLKYHAHILARMNHSSSAGFTSQDATPRGATACKPRTLLSNGMPRTRLQATKHDHILHPVNKAKESTNTRKRSSESDPQPWRLQTPLRIPPTLPY